MKFKYLINRILEMNYLKMFEIVKKISNKTGRSYLTILFDMIYCGLRFQAGYIDYDLFEMYNLKNKERKTIITRGINSRFVDYFNDPSLHHLFRNKGEFNKIFNKYLKRDWILLDNNLDEFSKFLKNKKIIFVKPICGTCGNGIEKININDYQIEELYGYLIKKDLLLVEDQIIQGDSLSKIYDGSINTIRLVTATKNNKATVVCAYLRIGNNNIVDNFNSGGMVVPIDIDSGTINYPAIDKKGNLYECHPISKTKIKGFKFDDLTEVIKLGLELAKIVPNMGLIGWDISISNKGPIVVEGNEFPGHDIYQLPAHRTNNIGMLDTFYQAFEKIGVNKKDIR